MATITVRALDSNWDVLAGNGTANFISDLAAVTQILAQSLKLYQGEWWENLSLGLPLFQSILGAPGSPKSIKAIIGLLVKQIYAVPYVTGISAISVTYQARRLQFSATVQTQFGTVTLSNSPASSATL